MLDRHHFHQRNALAPTRPFRDTLLPESVEDRPAKAGRPANQHNDNNEFETGGFQMSSSHLYNHPTRFTAILDDAGIIWDDFFEIVSLRVAGLKTFWTVAICQVSGVDG